MVSLTALCVGLAVWLWQRPGALARLAPNRGEQSRIIALFRGVRGGMALRTRTGLGVAVGAVIWLVAGDILGFVGGVVVGLVIVIALGQVIAADQVKRKAALVEALPQICELMAVCVEAGLPTRVAVDTLAQQVNGPAQDVLRGLSIRVRLGADEAAAWNELRQTPGWESFAEEVSRCMGFGSTLAPTLRVLALEAREKAAASATERAKKVGVRSVLPLMICFLPAFILLGIVPIIGGVVSSLFG